MSPQRQAAAIAFRRRKGNLEVCLIRRKDAGAWGIPKGLVDPGATLQETALNESWEEAGLRGRLIGEVLGTYTYEKWGATFKVAVYLMEVLEEEERWKESRIRERKWTTSIEAAALLAGHPVRRILKRAIDALA